MFYFMCTIKVYLENFNYKWLKPGQHIYFLYGIYTYLKGSENIITFFNLPGMCLILFLP